MIWSSTHGEIQYRHLDGEIWSEQEALTDTDGATSNPVLCGDGLGRLHLAWEDRRDGPRRIYYRQWDAGSWGTEEVIASPLDPYYPQIAAGQDGTPHVVWISIVEGFREIFYTSRADTGWAAAGQITHAPTKVWLPTIACDAQDRLHVVWDDVRQNQREIYALHMANGQWGQEERVTRVPSKSFLPSIHVDVLNALHVTWSDDRNEYHDIYYRRWTPAEGWSLHERLTLHESDAFRANLCVGPFGQMHMVWSDSRDGNKEIYYQIREPYVSWDPNLPPWIVEEPLPPARLDLGCRPNPFSTQTRIRMRSPVAGDWSVEVFDHTGRRVRTLRGCSSRPGLCEVHWDGRTQSGRRAPRGLYFLRLRSDGQEAGGRVLLLRP